MKFLFSSLFEKYEGLLHKHLRPIDDLMPLDFRVEDYFLQVGYQSRAKPKYFEDDTPGSEHAVWQPDVYSLAVCLASLRERRIIDLGCGKAEKLQSFATTFQIVGIDVGPNVEYCQRTYDFGRWIAHDFETSDALPLEPVALRGAVIICADVIEHLVNPMPLLRGLKASVDCGALVVLSTPERDLRRRRNDKGPPFNPSHVREWALGEMRGLLLHLGFGIPFMGLTANNNVERQMSTMLAILTKGEPECR